jgi:cell division protein FtsA
MDMPVRVAQPEGMMGLTDQLRSPAFSTSVGLLHWSMLMSEVPYVAHRSKKVNSTGSAIDLAKVKDWLKRLVP